MSTEQTPPSTYFSQLIRKKDNPQSGDQQQLLNLINKSISKVQDELQRGDLNISNKTTANQTLLQLKKERYKKEMDLLNREINKNDQMYKKAKREIIKQKKVESELMKEENQHKRKEIIERVKKWTQLQKELKEKRDALEAIKLKKQNQQDQRIKKQEEEHISFQKLEKKKQIEKKLKEIEENKVKREEIIKNAENQYQTLHPKYLEIEKKFRQLEEQMKFEQQILKKNHKMAMKIDHQQLKAHEKQYIAKVEQRLARRKSQHSIVSEDQKTQGAGFSQFLSRDEAKIAEDKQKLKRRKEFQEKLKEIPITIDESKKVKVEIAIDKGKNRAKYNFLGQKALNDFQIYGEFKDFQVNVNPRQIGKQYLKELPTITATSRITKSQSLNALTSRALSEKVKYKDYLQDLKTKRSQRGEKSDEQIKNIIRSHKQKSKAVEELNQRSKKYELQARKRKEQLQKYNGFASVVQKSKEVDEMYLKSIKAKLACLQMNQ